MHTTNLHSLGQFKGTNKNQLVDLDHNQIMKCVICHTDYIGLKILAMHTNCRKGLTTNHKIKNHEKTC